MSGRLAVWIFVALFLCGCGTTGPAPPDGDRSGPRLVAAPPLPATGRVLDLTQAVSGPEAMVEGDPPSSWSPARRLAAHLANSTRTGTVIEAQAMMVAGGRTVDALDVGEFVGPAVVVDLRPRLAAGDPDIAVGEEDLLRFEEEHGPIPGGAIVLLLTGWDVHFDRPELYLNQDAEGELHFPGFGEEAVRFLLRERNIRAIGADTASVDLGLNTDLDAHRALLEGGKYALENLRGLDRLPPQGATLVVAPLLLSGAARAPARVLAVLSR